MITDESFSKEWILGLKAKPEYSKSDPGLIEKMIYALYLVEQLKLNNLDFIFKGGTCLTIIFKKLRRFSIDVDIIFEGQKNVLEESLSGLVKSSKFSKYEKDEKRSHTGFINLPVVHYNLYYNPIFGKGEKIILLDVLFDKSPYKFVQSLPIENDLLSRDNVITEVTVPSVNDITSDKLTAFAPSTIGIPFKTGKELQIMKQLFDIGFLYNSADDLKCMKETFLKISTAQNSYRQTSFSADEILSDTIQTSLILALQNCNKDVSKERFSELNNGIHSINSYLPGLRFGINEAVEFSARAALLAARLKAEDFSPLPNMNQGNYKPSDFMIAVGEYQPLNKMLKNMPNFSLFYWYHVVAALS
jgi:hypothetical protein